MWSEEPLQVTADLYAPDVVVEDLADPSRQLHGRDERQELERRLFTRIPDHRVEVLRLLEVDGPRAVLECLVRGRASTDPCPMAVPALVWWELDGKGRIAREAVWFRWRDRRPDDGRAAGWLTSPLPPGPPIPAAEVRVEEPRSRSWYRAFATHLAETWSWDPVLADRAIYDDDCVIETARRPGAVLRGRAAIEAADAALAARLPRPDRRLSVQDVLGEGGALALRVALEGREEGRGPLLRAHGALVLSLDGSDRVVSARTYLDWSSAAPVG